MSMLQPLFVRPLMVGEREALQKNSNSSNKDEAVRACVVLLSAGGKTAAEISGSIGSHPSNVKKWIRKFNAEGLEGIAAKKRGPQGGPRPNFTTSQIEQILLLAKAPPHRYGYRF